MILKHKESGMVIEQVVITEDKHVWYQRLTGIIREPGASKFAVGQHIAWPYDAGDWEEVGE